MPGNCSAAPGSARELSATDCCPAIAGSCGTASAVASCSKLLRRRSSDPRLHARQAAAQMPMASMGCSLKLQCTRACVTCDMLRQVWAAQRSGSVRPAPEVMHHTEVVHLRLQLSSAFFQLPRAAVRARQRLAAAGCRRQALRRSLLQGTCGSIQRQVARWYITSIARVQQNTCCLGPRGTALLAWTACSWLMGAASSSCIASSSCRWRRWRKQRGMAYWRSGTRSMMGTGNRMLQGGQGR